MNKQMEPLSGTKGAVIIHKSGEVAGRFLFT